MGILLPGIELSTVSSTIELHEKELQRGKWLFPKCSPISSNTFAYIGGKEKKEKKKDIFQTSYGSSQNTFSNHFDC